MPSRANDADERCRIRWNERIARAETLAADQPAASQLLTFFAALAARQKSLLDRPRHTALAAAGPEASEAAFAEAFDLEPALQAVPELLTWLTLNAPQTLAEAAARCRALERDDWHAAMRSHLIQHEADADDPTVSFVVASVLRPFAERLAIQRQASARKEASTRPTGADTASCPVCGSRPIVGVLREEGHGAKRTLVCSLCLTEYDYLRVVCPRCGEQKFDALPVYTAEQVAHVRVDACDSCRTYLKTIDLSKDGLAVPLVDDLASVALDLWARDRGYARLSPNVLMI
jgi:FdhE protein